MYMIILLILVVVSALLRLLIMLSASARCMGCTSARTMVVLGSGETPVYVQQASGASAADWLGTRT
jgi:hypothetical protein